MRDLEVTVFWCTIKRDSTPLGPKTRWMCNTDRLAQQANKWRNTGCEKRDLDLPGDPFMIGLIVMGGVMRRTEPYPS